MSAPGGVFRSKPWRIAAVAAGMLLLGGFGIYFTATKEPVYRGHSLSWWLGHYEQNQKNGIWDSDPAAQESQDALRTIGTNAIPTLLRWIQTPESPFKDKINSLLNKQPIIAFRFQPATQGWSMAYNGFQALGMRLPQSSGHDLYHLRQRL